MLGCGVVSPSHPDAGDHSVCPGHPEICVGSCCGTQCLATDDDPRNCGACGNICPDGTVCNGGHCGCPPGGVACGMGQACCGALGCVSMDSDIRNCGGCGIVCGNGATCSGGKCMCQGHACNIVTPDMSGDAPPPGSCTCSDRCAGTSTHECVGHDCCWEDAFVYLTCAPDKSCAPWTYK